MLDERSRSAALRRPQGGTPPNPLSEEWGEDELVGDEALLQLGQQSATHAALCGPLLRTQIQVYKRLRHIISFNDEYTMRRIRNAARTGRLPNIYCRCMRCGCLAHIIDWFAAVNLADEPTMADRRWPTGRSRPATNRFFTHCEGSVIAEEGLLLMD